MNSEIYCDRYTLAAGSNKFEAGTPNTAGILSWATAVDYLNAYGWDKMQAYEFELKRYMNQEFRKLKNIEYINPYAKYPIAVFNIKGVHPQDAASYLAQKKIIVRSGLSCAKLSPKITGVDGAVRASFYIYNDKKDVDTLVKALKTYKKGSELNNVI
jgi:cysteine desulfurase/selenocysteine lyase